VTLLPGDLIVFHGLVYGERGLCLVIASGISGPGFSGNSARVMTPQFTIIMMPDNDPEGDFWSRINERRG